MTLQLQTDDSIQKVIRTYSLVHTLFFGLGVTLCVIIAAVVVGTMLFHRALQQNSFLRTDSSLQQEQMLLGSMSSILDEYAGYEGIQVLIKQGYLSLTGDAIVSVDNVLTYKGLVIPRLGKISLAAALPSIDMIASGGYHGDDLSNYVQNTIMTYPDIRNLTGTDIELLSFGNSLIDYFGISCITTPKVTDHFCQQAIVAMVDVLPVYDLSQDLEGLEKIAAVLQQTSSQRKFCDAIKRYVFFSHESGESIKTIMYDCGKEYENSYNDFASFRSVQEQLDKQSINATISLNPLINAYKLVSTQQAIYYELSNRRINDVRIRAYLKYNEELLRRPESLQKTYFDVIAWFNNQYLIPTLTRLYFQQKGQETTTIKSLLENIRMINEGNNVLAYPGLSQLVIDKTLIAPRSQTLIDTGVVLRPLLDMFMESYSFPHFSITQQRSGENDTLTLQGSRTFDKNVGLAPKVNSTLTLTYDGVRFRVMKASFSGFPRVEQAVTTLLQTQIMTIAELYDLLVKNGASFNAAELGICDIVRSLSGYVSCDAQTIVFTGSPLSGGKIVSYTLTHKDGILSSYIIDHKELNTAIHADLGTPQTSPLTMFSFIQNMLQYRLGQQANAGSSLSGAADILQIRQSFLSVGAKVGTITSQEKPLYSVSFTLKDISLIARYDINKSLITALDIVRDDVRYPIRGFTLSLTNIQAPTVQGFITDPRTVLMQFDPLTVKKSGI